MGECVREVGGQGEGRSAFLRPSPDLFTHTHMHTCTHARMHTHTLWERIFHCAIKASRNCGPDNGIRWHTTTRTLCNTTTRCSEELASRGAPLALD